MVHIFSLYSRDWKVEEYMPPEVQAKKIAILYRNKIN
jgi:hypothetical protein